MSKKYTWPIPAEHSEVVLCIAPGSMPCRAVMYMVEMFGLPVDFCGMTFDDKGAYSPDHLALNPIHSIPAAMAFVEGRAKPVCISGSIAIVDLLVRKYRALIPDSFVPRDPVLSADVLQKVDFILNTANRATAMQFVYPTLGLMTECQYDICKRDFSLQIIEGWLAAPSASPGPYFHGAEPSLADLYFHSLYMLNNWVQLDDIELPWKHKDVLPMYPKSQAMLTACAALPAVHAIDNLSLGPTLASVTAINASGMFGMLSKRLPGNARKFDYSGDIHPNFVAFNPDLKAKIDGVMNL